MDTGTYSMNFPGKWSNFNVMLGGQEERMPCNFMHPVPNLNWIFRCYAHNARTQNLSHLDHITQNSNRFCTDQMAKLVTAALQKPFLIPGYTYCFIEMPLHCHAELVAEMFWAVASILCVMLHRLVGHESKDKTAQSVPATSSAWKWGSASMVVSTTHMGEWFFWTSDPGLGDPF